MMWWRPSGLQRQHAFFVLMAWVQKPFVSVSRAVWSVVLLVMSLYSAWNNIRHFSEFSAPLAYGTSYVHQFWQGGVQWFADRQALQEEIARLRAHVQDLEQSQQYSGFVMSENQHLKSMLDVKGSFAWKTECVEVLAVPFERGASSMWVATTPTLKAYQSVVTQDGLIGRVDGVNRYTARVRLVTDSLSRLPVRLEGASNEMLLAGQNNHELVVLHQKKTEGDCVIPQVGMRLLTTGYHDFPPNIPVAVIARIENQKIYARPIATPHQAHYVHVICDNQALDRVSN